MRALRLCWRGSTLPGRAPLCVPTLDNYSRSAYLGCMTTRTAEPPFTNTPLPVFTPEQLQHWRTLAAADGRTILVDACADDPEDLEPECTLCLDSGLLTNSHAWVQVEQPCPECDAFDRKYAR